MEICLKKIIVCTVSLSRLLLLESHFTWALSEEDFSPHDLVNRLREQIELELKSGEARVTRSYCSLAYVRYLYGDLVEALADLRKSEDLAKRHFGKRSEKFLMVTYGDFAWLYFHMGKVSLAEYYLKKVDEIRVKFGSSNEVHNEVLREKGWAFLKFSRKYYNGAGECFRLALETNPDDRDLNAGYAIALYRTTFDPPGSRDSMTIAQLKRAIDLNPEDAVLLVFLMIEYVEAIMLVAKALKMSPENPHVMRYVSQFCRKLGSVDFAICQLEKTLVHTPDSAFTNHQLGLCYITKMIEFEKKYGQCHKTENYEAQNCLRKSIYHLERAVSLKPLFIVALATLAVQYGQMGNILKAEELFQQAFQLAYKKKEHLQVVYELYGRFQLYSKRSEQCEKGLRDIAKHRAARDPKDSKSYAIEGFIHELKGEKLNAEVCYKKALTTGVAIGK
uniref:Uncharacterized protein n=1 Tax=Astyanax mexicanus TaxID=7994 RepID=A0A3B1JYC6_ASTMX